MSDKRWGEIGRQLAKGDPWDKSGARRDLDVLRREHEAAAKALDAYKAYVAAFVARCNTSAITRDGTSGNLTDLLKAAVRAHDEYDVARRQQ